MHCTFIHINEEVRFKSVYGTVPLRFLSKTVLKHIGTSSVKIPTFYEVKLVRIHAITNDRTPMQAGMGSALKIM